MIVEPMTAEHVERLRGLHAQALDLMERENERDASALLAAVQARLNAKAAPAPTGDAEVVELRPGGPVEVGPAAA